MNGTAATAEGTTRSIYFVLVAMTTVGLPASQPRRAPPQNLGSISARPRLDLASISPRSSQVGFGDILPLSLLETVVAVLIVLLGGLSYPAVISSILPLMSSLNAMAEAHKAKLRHLRRWLDKWGAPTYVSRAVLAHHEALYAECGGVDEEAVRSRPRPTSSPRARLELGTPWAWARQI